MVQRLVSNLRAMVRNESRMRILLIGLALLLILLLAVAFCSRRETPPLSSQAPSSEDSRVPGVSMTVHSAHYPVYQGCWTMDFAPLVSIRLHRDPQSGQPVAEVAYAPKEDTANIEWHPHPLSFAGFERKDFAAEWDPPVLTLTHPIATVEEWAWFNADRFPEGGLAQVLTYEGDRATLTVGDMAARLVKAGTAVRYRITFHKVEGHDEYGAFVSHDPAYSPLVVTKVVYWPSTRIFTLGADGFEVSLLPNVDGDTIFREPAPSGWVLAGGRMRPILEGHTINFRRLVVRDGNGRPLEAVPRAVPVTVVAEAASHCPYAQETARLKVLADNFSPFDETHPWEEQFIDLVETAPTSGIFVTQRPFALDWPVTVLFEGEERPRLRLVPEGLGSRVPKEAGRVFRIPYATTGSS